MNAETPDAQSGARRSDRRSRASLPDPLIGRSLGRYHILGALGRGGASVVYLAEVAAPSANAPVLPAETPPADAPVTMSADGAPEPAGRVALKVLAIPDDLPEEEQYGLRMRFVRETRILERLRHPHILAVIEAAEADGYAYLAMPYVAGGTLARRLTVRHGPLPLAEVAVYLGQVAGALDAAHAFGVVHRDVKPSNILLDGEGHNAYLTDFGIASLSGAMARLMEPAADPMTLTLVGTTIGTPSYMAPEQITGDRVSAATDIYALGVVVYQLVTGQTPFQGETPLQVAVRQVSDPPRPPRLLRDDLPAPAEAAMLRALAKAPADRFPTATAFADAFAAGLRGEWTPGLDAPGKKGRRQRLRLPWRARKPTTSTIPTAPTTPTGDALIAVGADQRRMSSTLPLAPAMARRLALAAPYAPTLPLLIMRQTGQRMVSLPAAFSCALSTVTNGAYVQYASYIHADVRLGAQTAAGMDRQAYAQIGVGQFGAETTETTEAPLRVWWWLSGRIRRSLASALLALVAVALFGLAFVWALASFPGAPSMNAPITSGQRSANGATGGDQRLASLPTATATPPTTNRSFIVHGRYVYAYDAAGALFWRFKAAEHIIGQPTLGDGVVYVATAHDAYTLRLSDGKLLTHHTHHPRVAHLIPPSHTLWEGAGG